MPFEPFVMERWQSLHEHRVPINLAESGVHPVPLRELEEMAEEEGIDVDGIRDLPLGYGQTNGSDELREQIAALHPGASADHVMATLGGAEANFVALWRLAEGGVPGAVVMPTYMQAPGLLRSWGSPLVEVPLQPSAGWQPDPSAVAAALEEAEFLVVTNPGNPVGVQLSEASIDAVLEAADRTGAWVLADEVYRGAELDAEETRTLFGRGGRVLSTGSLSKAYGLPGLRLGWLVGPPDVVEELWGRTDYTTIGPSILSDALARIALVPGVRDRLLARTRGILRRNLRVLSEWMADQDGRIEGPLPAAGAIAWLRVEPEVDTAALAERLRADEGVLIVPGEQFERPGWMRLGYGSETGLLEEGLTRIARALR